MALTYNTRSYTEHRNTPDSIMYAGPANTLTLKDYLSLGRVLPKPTASFAGVARPSIKQVKTVTVNSVTGETADMIYTVSASIPVGALAADIDALHADLAAFVNTTDCKALFKTLKLNF